MQRILILISFAFASYCCSGQFTVQSSQIFGGSSLDEARDIALNSDTSRIFWGARTSSTDGDIPSNAGGTDYWITKWDLNGGLLWSKTYGGFNSDDLTNVMPHPDGGAIAFGTTTNDQGIFGTLHGNSGGWLMRVSNTGELILGQIYGSGLNEIAVDAFRHISGNVTMAIEATSGMLNGQANHGVSDVWIVNVDPIFNIRWSKLMGGTLKDAPAAITSDINSNIYVAATSYSNLSGLDPNAGGADVWVFKLNAQGDLLWQKNFGGSGDDIASDILFHTDGNVYVTAHSTSNDGDFNTNFGSNDIWILKLDADDGLISSSVHHGGSGNDINAKISKYGSHHLVISATTNSPNVELTGNKGFNDVWIFTTDLNGNLHQQMNYGGSLNDVSADIVVIDSVFHVFSISQSSDKNVPSNSFSQQDVWYMTLNTNPSPCSDQLKCYADSTLNNELFPPSTNVLLCVQGCNEGLQPGPFFVQGPCADFENGTAFFKLTTDANADLLTLSVSSDEMNQPQIALLRSGNCSTYTQIKCGTGTNGFVLMQYINVTPLTTYVIAISDAEGNEGGFDLCATAINVEFCNERDSLYVTSTSFGSAKHGPYKPGEDVHFCYELLDWNKLDCNGFQGIVPTFGPGWDPSNFDIFGMPLHVDELLSPVSNGFWDWYKVGDVRYNISNPINGFDGGQGMPAGWYFTNLGDPPPNNGPDQTVGDINDCTPTSDRWKICFTLEVLEECETSLDASVSIRTFSDGELGSRESLACAYDQGETYSATMVCCSNPGMEVIHDLSICSKDTAILMPQTNMVPPITYSWVAIPESGIEGAFSTNDANRFYQVLRNNTGVPHKVQYIFWAESESCQTDLVEFFVEVLPLPSSRISLNGPGTVCQGSTVTLNFENTGTPPFAIELLRDNVFFANILSENPTISIDIEPESSARFRVGKVKDALCEGDGIGIVIVTIKPNGTTLIDTSICEGESFTAGGQVFSESGMYTVTLNGAASNNCDSVISLILEVIPPLTETLVEEICHGDTIYILGEPYYEPTDEVIQYFGPEGCPNYIHLQLSFIDTTVIVTNEAICAGDTLEFAGTGVFQSGTYSHVEETSPGCFEKTILNLTVLPPIIINDVAIEGDNGTGNGAILVEIIGGSPPFTYLWNTGQTTGSLFNVPHGEYSMTATDSHGCHESFNFVVPFVTSTTEAEALQEDLKIWPTLVSGGDKIYLLCLSGKLVGIKEIQWWDVSGQLISSTNPKNNILPMTIDVPAIGGNLCFIRITLMDGGSKWFKVIIQ